MSGLVRIEREGDGYHYNEPGWTPVWFASLYPAVPIFHHRGEYTDRAAELLDDGWTRKEWAVWTDCGQHCAGASWEEIRAGTWQSRGYTELSRGHNVPVLHAVKFGRPCRKCWP